MKWLWALLNDLADGELPQSDARLIRPPWWVLALLLAVMVACLVSSAKGQELQSAPCATEQQPVKPAKKEKRKWLPVADGCVKEDRCVGGYEFDGERLRCRRRVARLMCYSAPKQEGK
jgi:hypothetical protein